MSSPTHRIYFTLSPHPHPSPSSSFLVLLSRVRYTPSSPPHPHLGPSILAPRETRPQCPPTLLQVRASRDGAFCSMIGWVTSHKQGQAEEDRLLIPAKELEPKFDLKKHTANSLIRILTKATTGGRRRQEFQLPFQVHITWHGMAWHSIISHEELQV